MDLANSVTAPEVSTGGLPLIGESLDCLHVYMYTVKMKDAAPRGKFTIYITDEMRRKLRIRAIEEGTSATKIVESLIKDYLKHPKTRR